jgi:hypothetical protein
MLALANGSPGLAQAQGAWLEGPLESWNQARMQVPTAPPRADDPYLDPRCWEQVRPAEIPEDEVVAAAGWSLYGSYEGGWGVRIVRGTVSFDGMCRPMGFQDFIFVEGAFAGTISPEPMRSRTTGAASIAAIRGGQGLTASFVRYAEGDPLCCPSLPHIFISYDIEWVDAAPVLIPVQGL